MAVRVLHAHIRTNFDTNTMCTELTDMKKGKDWYTNLITQASRGTPVLKDMIRNPGTYSPPGAQELREYNHWQGELIGVFKTKARDVIVKAAIIQHRAALLAKQR